MSFTISPLPSLSEAKGDCPLMGQRILVCVWLGLVMLASGCVSSGNPSVMDQDRISQIKLNTSTKEDVRRILGQPTSSSRHSGSYSAFPGLPPSTVTTNIEVWSYSHINVDVSPATYIPIVGLFAGGATSNISVFTVSFDEEGIVRHISSTQSQAHSGFGSGGASKPTKPREYSNPSSRPALPTSDDSDAARYEKLAAMGIADSQYNLGRLYANGQGVPQDYVQAHMWYNLAAANGYESATRSRDDLATRMTPDQIAEAQKLAREWKPKGK